MANPLLSVLAVGLIAIGASACAELDLEAGPLSHDPNVAQRLDAEDNFLAGRAQLAIGHYGLALTHLRRADRERPGDVGILNAMGAAYDRMGRVDLAERAYAQALVMEPESPLTLNNYGYSLLLARRYKEAAAVLARAYELGKSSPFEATIRANLQLLQSRTRPMQAALAGEDVVIGVTDTLERTHALQQTSANGYALTIGYLLPAPVLPVTAQPISPAPPRTEKDEPSIHSIPSVRVPKEVIAAARSAATGTRAAVARPWLVMAAALPEASEDEMDRTVAFWRYEQFDTPQRSRPSSLPGRPSKSPRLARQGLASRRDNPPGGTANTSTAEAT